MTLFGGLAVPMGGLGEVLFHALAQVEAVAQLTLGLGMVLFGGLFQVHQTPVPVGFLFILLIPLFRRPVCGPGFALGRGVSLPGGFAEPLHGLSLILFRAPAPGIGGAQPPLGRRVAAVRQAAEAALGGGSVLGRVKPPHHQLHQAWALLRLPRPAQGVGGFGGCHRESGGVLFIVAGPVIPASGADGGCGVFLVTYRAFPHGGSSLDIRS